MSFPFIYKIRPLADSEMPGVSQALRDMARRNPALQAGLHCSLMLDETQKSILPKLSYEDDKPIISVSSQWLETLPNTYQLATLMPALLEHSKMKELNDIAANNTIDNLAISSKTGAATGAVLITAAHIQNEIEKKKSGENAETMSRGKFITDTARATAGGALLGVTLGGGASIAYSNKTNAEERRQMIADMSVKTFVQASAQPNALNLYTEAMTWIRSNSTDSPTEEAKETQQIIDACLQAAQSLQKKHAENPSTRRDFFNSFFGRS